MNGLDIALLVILFFFFVRGIFRGFTKEIVSIAGLIIAFIVAIRYYPQVSESIKTFVQNPSYRQTIGFLILFLGSFMVISLLGIILDKLFKVTMSKYTNGLLGGVFALAKGIGLSAVVLMAATAFISPESSFYKESTAWPYIQSLSETFKEYVPEDLKQAFNNKINELPADLKPLVPDIPTSGAEEPPPWQPVPEPSEPPPPPWPGTTEESPTDQQ